MKRVLIFFIIFMFFIPTPISFCAPPRSDVAERDAAGKIKRSAAAKREFRREYPCPASGTFKGSCPGYVIDHVIALKRGGADHPENMQWQTIEEASAKDRWE